MYNFKRLSEKYVTEPAFNQAVNLFTNMIEQYGFTPSEIREAVFLAQYNYEIGQVKQYLYTEEQQRALVEAVTRLKNNFMMDVEELKKEFSK